MWVFFGVVCLHLNIVIGTESYLELFSSNLDVSSKLVLHDSTPRLPSLLNQVSSFKVFGEDGWYLYEQGNFAGKSALLKKGEYPYSYLGNLWYLRNDRLTSVKRIDAKDCINLPVGLQNPYVILDSAFSASCSGSASSPHMARINYGAGVVALWKACAANDWIQVNLGDIYAIYAIGTQGGSDSSGTHIVQQYKVSFSVDGVSFTTYRHNGIERIFSGHTQTNWDTIVKNVLENPREAQYVRLTVLEKTESYPGDLAVRMEVYGCDSCFTSVEGFLNPFSAADFSAMCDESNTTCVEVPSPQGLHFRGTLAMGNLTLTFQNSHGDLYNYKNVFVIMLQEETPRSVKGAACIGLQGQEETSAARWDVVLRCQTSGPAVISVMFDSAHTKARLELCHMQNDPEI